VIGAAAVLAALLSASPASTYEADIDAAFAETACIYQVPKALVLAIISVESGFHPRAVSRTGAKGLMQLMPDTARRVGISAADLFEPRLNLMGGVRLLAVLLRHYEGDVMSTLVAYNARPRALFAPLPRNGETPRYVSRVLDRMRWFDRELRARQGRLVAPIEAGNGHASAGAPDPPRCSGSRGGAILACGPGGGC
jgi:soluble lytic murein transglycosylase-like protein